MKLKLTDLRTGFLHTVVLSLALCLTAGLAGAQTMQTMTFTTNGTWTVPDGVASIKVQAIGGGGAGGAVYGRSQSSAAGGGGGGYAESVITVKPGDVITVTVGQGGTSLSDGKKADGGNSVVAVNSVNKVYAGGGKSVDRNGTTGGDGGTGTHTGGKGGNASAAGTYCEGGGGGGAAGPTGNGGNGGNGTRSVLDTDNAGKGGTNGGAPAGNGGKGHESSILGGWEGEGDAGSYYGGGGGGSTHLSAIWNTSNDGGAGAPGVVVITYTPYDCASAVTMGKITTPSKSYCYSASVAGVTLEHATITPTYSATDFPFVTGWQKSTNLGSTWSNINYTTLTDINTGLLTQPIYYRYYVKFNGCTDTIFSTDTLKLTVYPELTVSIDVPTNLCPKENEYLFHAVPSGGVAPYSYVWIPAMNPSPADNSYAAFDNSVVKYNCGTTYTADVTVTDAVGCVATQQQSATVLSMGTINSVTVTAIPSGNTDCSFKIPELKNAILNEYVGNCSDAVEILGYTKVNNSTSYDVNVGDIIYADQLVYANVVLCDLAAPVWVPVNVNLPATRSIEGQPFSVSYKNSMVVLDYGASDTAYVYEEPDYVTGVADYQGYLTITHSNLAPRIAPGNYQITWTFTDPCGNSIDSVQNVTVVLPPCGGTYTVTDIEGNVYSTVRIGVNCWTKENLKSTKYSDGTPIAMAKSYYSELYPDSVANRNTFGRLYTWYSTVRVSERTMTDPALNVNGRVQGVCPDGWFVPTIELFAPIFGMSVNDARSNTEWLPGANSTSADPIFAAFPAGYYDSSADKYFNLHGDAYFWSTVTTSAAEALACTMHNHCPMVLSQKFDKGFGFSVRCVKDK